MKRYGKLGWILFLFCASLSGAPYTDNGNGTVTDSATGLIWQKCSAGQGTTLGNCSTGSISDYSWSSAITYCESLTLGGRSDWRLPNVNELRSIVNYASTSSPRIDSITFPSTVDLFYWSSSTYVLNTSIAWGVFFRTGEVDYNNKTSNRYVRCTTGS